MANGWIKSVSWKFHLGLSWTITISHRVGFENLVEQNWKEKYQPNVLKFNEKFLLSTDATSVISECDWKKLAHDLILRLKLFPKVSWSSVAHWRRKIHPEWQCTKFYRFTILNTTFMSQNFSNDGWIKVQSCEHWYYWKENWLIRWILCTFHHSNREIYSARKRNKSLFISRNFSRQILLFSSRVRTYS